MFTYAAFIDELRGQLERARSLFDRARLGEDEEFRRWRHEVTDLMSRIASRKYRINCHLVSRNFDAPGSYTHSPSKAERMAAYNRDLRDTITELETLVAHFEKYGDPKAEPTSQLAPESSVTVPPPPIEQPKLRPPEKVTPAWLWQYAPVTLWLQGFGLLAASFVAGVAVGQSALYAELSARVSGPNVPASAPSAAAASSPAKK
jgi:hypothetical protein